MKIILSIFSTILFFSNTVNANDEINSGTAITMCKDKLAEKYTDLTRTKTRRIKDRRGIFSINFKVYLEEESFNAICIVNKEGELTIEND